MTECWVNHYIGKPWVSGAQGPDEFDCYGLFRHIQQKQFGIQVPFVTVDADNIHAVMCEFHEPVNYSGWHQQNHGKHGDAVIMRHHKYPSHIGVWIDDFNQRGVLHCVFGQGVVFSTLSALKLSAWSNLQFWRYNNDHARNHSHP